MPGLILKKKTGDKVKKGEGLVDIYYNNNQNIQQCIELLQKSIVLSDELHDAPALLLDYIC
jgi:thymidine phosphorylase